MANTITGIILFIGDTVAVQSQNGQPFNKRELVLDASRYEQFTGRKIENYPKLEFIGNKCSILDQFQVGQLVTVSFFLSGRKSEKNGYVNYFTNVTGYDVELYQRQPDAQQAANYQGQAVQPQPATPTQPMAGEQPFPPAVDENGNPIGNDDLPF